MVRSITVLGRLRQRFDDLERDMTETRKELKVVEQVKLDVAVVKQRVESLDATVKEVGSQVNRLVDHMIRSDPNPLAQRRRAAQA
jgi:hypothetical protein